MQELSRRRRARELTLQVLFQKEFVSDIDSAASLDYFRNQLDVPGESLAFAQQLLEGIEKYKSEIDQKIANASRNWKISRMSSVDLNILRMGVFELVYTQNETPAHVIIDEAVEIAKRYGNTDSHAFVNGILDEIHKSR